MTDIPANTTTTAHFEGDPSVLATFSGEFETFGDTDWIKLTLVAGTTYQFFGSANGAGANIYAQVTMALFNAAGTQLTTDALPGGYNSAFSFTAASSGTYFVEMQNPYGIPDGYSVAVGSSESTQFLGAGADVFSGAGSTRIVGGPGDDQIHLETGFQTDALGEQGDDTIYGDDLGNFISGGLNNDSIFGGLGDDRLFGDAGNDYIRGEAGNDHIYGGDGSDELEGRTGSDTIFGGNGSDVLVGDEESDTLNGGPGQDQMAGGPGNDTFFVDDTADKVFEFPGQGTDTVYSSVSFVLGANQEIEILRASTAAAVNLTGNRFANTLIGNNAANVLTGNSGNDILPGLAGNDVLRGNAGSDVLTGGGGKDVLTGGLNADFFVFNAGLNASTNIDTVTDFSHADDTIRLENAVFKALASAGPLNAAFFYKGAAAHDGNDHIIYNTATGALFYDADGTGAHAQVQFATLANKPTNVTYGDFVVI